MISVGSIDGRQLSGLGLEMEGNELEEGEAGCFQNDGDDSTIDPDIALSYIGEKLQNVLGHFQKDFEGGVSAENLGAKFGGYGSFLPTYQRSPSWSRLRSSPEVHNYSGPRFPNNPHSEDGRENSFASTRASLSARPGASSGKTATMHDSVKRDVSTPSTHAEELTSNVDLVKKSGNPSERRTLKVRIKVGAENLSTRQNAEIYSGLGLDVSPSSSLDDNPIVSEGLCGNNQDLPEEPDESPTSILQIMTSFPAHGSLLLSPLSDDLIRLFEKGKLNGESESKLMHNENLESSGMLFSGSLSRGNQKVLTQKKWKSSEKDRAFPTHLINEKNNDSLLKKETDTDVLGCEELVSNALKLPLLLSSQHVVGDPTKDISKEVDISAKDGVKDKTCSGLIKKEILGSEFAQHTDRVEKYDEDLHPPDKVWESKKANFGIDSAACPQEDGHKSEKARFESNFFKGRKAPGAEATNPSKQSAVQKEASSNEDGVKLTPGKEMLSSGSRKKSKGVRTGGSQGSDVSKDQLMLDSSLMPKNRKSSLSNNLMSKNDSLDFKRNPGKPGDRYKDFFGDLELEEEDSESISGEVRSPRRHKDSQLVIKRSISECHGALKEKNDVKKFIKPSPYSAVASSMDPKTLRGPTSDANLAGVDPLDQEDWVQCDRCQQWRLLPLGTNPQILPDKWRCRMLTWLPGMNHCSIPEEQTTKALRALNHLAPASALAPASESHQNLLNYPAGTLLEVSSVTAKCLGREQQNIGSEDINMISGKKKHGSMDMTNSSDLDDPTHFLDSQKNDVKVSGKNELNYSPSVDAYQHLRHSSSVVGEKRKDMYNKKEKKSSLDGHSDRGTNSKVKNKREPDSESFRISKKVKSENVHFGDENWTSDNGGDSSKAGRSSSSGLLNNAAETDQSKYANPKDSRGDAKKSAKNPETNKPGTSDDGLLCMTKYDHHDSVKKRKGNEHHDLPSAERHPKDREAFVEETHESNHGKEKKTRIFKSEGKDTSRSTGNVGMDKNGRSMKDQLIDNAADYLKSSMGSLQPSVAANSSSSKVSGSCKNKPSVHEMKGSPVESVSSSPFRYPDADKFSSAGRNPVHKDEFQDSEAFTMARPGRVWGGEDNGGDERPGTVIKDANHNVTNHDSLESHALEFSNRDLSQASDGKVKAESLNCRDVGTEHATNVFVDCLGQGNEECQDEERTNTQNSGHQTKKSGKGYSSRSKDKNHNSRLDIDKGKNKISDSSLEFVDHLHSHEEKLKSKRNKCDEKFVTPDKVDKIFISKNDSAEGILSDSGKGESQLKFGGHNGSDVTKGHDKKQKVQWDYNDEKSSKKIISGTSDRVGFESNGRGKSHSLPPLSRGQAETQASMSGSKNENEEKILAIDAFENGDASKAHRQGKKAEKSGSQPFRTRHSTPEVHKGRDLEAPSPNRRDSSSHAATNAVKEAKALKHMADRKKSSGSTESTGLYFQAALKFLHGASLLESGNNERTKHNETIQSTQMYSSTAKLCEFCAHEYEKLKDMAAAALAYKCMEVAYMKVIYSSHTSASRDRNELQNVLQIVPPGESPSSSASDVDNLNNQSIVDKAALAKGVSLPQVAGSHVIPPRNRSSFTRLLNYAQDVSFAMEASRKSRIAFTAANPRLGETQLREGISAVKKALDFNFQDVDGLLRLVRVAMEAISR